MSATPHRARTVDPARVDALRVGHRQDVRDLAAHYAEQLAELFDVIRAGKASGALRKEAREAAAGVLRYSESDAARELARSAFYRLADDRVRAEVSAIAEELEEAGAKVPARAAEAVIRARTEQAAAHAIADAEAGRLRVRGGRRA